MRFPIFLIPAITVIWLLTGCAKQTDPDALLESDLAAYDFHMVQGDGPKVGINEDGQVIWSGHSGKLSKTRIEKVLEADKAQSQV